MKALFIYRNHKYNTTTSLDKGATMLSNLQQLGCTITSVTIKSKG